MTRKKPNPWANNGGARPGAGRPPKPDKKITRTICVDPVVIDYLDSTGNRSVEVERIVKSSDEFREWRGNK